MAEALPLYVAGFDAQRRMFVGDHGNLAIAVFSVRCRGTVRPSPCGGLSCGCVR